MIKTSQPIFPQSWKFFIIDFMTKKKNKNHGKRGIETLINFKHVKAATSNFICVFSKDDPVVPLDENIKLFEQRINPKIIVEQGRGHFSGSDGVTELPSALNSILELAKNE